MIEQRERLERLKSMLAQTSPEGSIESVKERRPRTAAPSALEGFTEARLSEEEAHVQSGLEKLATGKEEAVTPAEQFFLEAIVLPENRPVAFVREGSYDDLPGVWSHLNAPEVRARLVPRLGSVGRVELPRASWLPYGGTGFIVGKGLLMTNRHVAKLFADGLGLGTRIRYVAGDAAVSLRRFVDSAPNDERDVFTVTKVEMIHPFWDMALLRVEGLRDDLVPLKLSVRTPEELLQREIVVVGYPARDDRNDLALQDRIFQRTYNVKRLHPGLVQQRRQIRSFETTVSALTHDSSTLGGDSGSAVIDVQTGEVVALHFAGEYLKANYGVPAHELARDSRVVDAGVNFTGSVAPTREFDPAWLRAGGVESAPTTVSPPADAPPVKLQAAALSANGATWSIPLSVTISLGQPTIAPLAAAQPLAIAAEEAPRMAAPVIFGGLEHRKGFQPNFLELAGNKSVPLPELTALGRSVVAKLEDGSFELKYHKFSIVVHKGRRLALFTAANVDWQREHRLIDGKKPSRKELTGLAEGTQELWVTDWRIPEEHQLPDIFFTKDDAAFDKGHLIRRDDVCWGKTFKDMQKANGDTYHTTNCSPQTAAFNRSTEGVDNWGDLENLVQAQTKAEKAITFAGPVLAEDDRQFVGRDEAGTLRVQIPSRFWKIILVNGDDGPAAYGFVLEQDLSAVPLEFAVPAQWRKYLVSIEEIERLLDGLATLDWLKQHDRHGSDEAVRLAKQLK
jgi:endonuclease G, mitochondrial